MMHQAEPHVHMFAEPVQPDANVFLSARLCERYCSAMEAEADLTSYVDNSDDEAPPLPPPPLPPSPSSDPVMSGVLADDGSAAAAAPAGRGRGRGRGGGGSAIAGLAELDQSMGFRPPAGRSIHQH
jgi:hypothetical protein